LLLVRVVLRGRSRAGERRGCGPAVVTRPLPPGRTESPVISRPVAISGWGIPGADHDRGQFWSLFGHFCPWSWNSMVRGCSL